jgi:hypothetical protein
MAYDDPNAVLRREIQTGNITGIASTTIGKFLFFQKTQVKQVKALVVVAGTDAAAGVDIYNGTTSIGAIVVGTNTAGTIVNSGTLDAEIAASSFLDIRGKAGSATMILAFCIEHQVRQDAVRT